MKEEVEAAQAISDLIVKTPIGQTVTFKFSGKPTPILVTFKFAGGWVIQQRVIPGTPLEFVRGEDDYLKGIQIDLLPYEGLK